MNECVVDLRELGDEPMDLRGSIGPGLIESRRELFRTVKRLDWFAAIERAGEEVRLRGQLNTAVSVSCVRCLESVEQPVDRDFDLYFRQEDSLIYDEDADVQLEERDTRTSFISGAELQLDGIFREQVLLAMPMKPLCREDCRGLCPSCGINHNLDSCECFDQSTNPVFEGLLELKKRLQERSN